MRWLLAYRLRCLGSFITHRDNLLSLVRPRGQTGAPRPGHSVAARPPGGKDHAAGGPRRGNGLVLAPSSPRLVPGVSSGATAWPTQALAARASHQIVPHRRGFRAGESAPGGVPPQSPPSRTAEIWYHTAAMGSLMPSAIYAKDMATVLRAHPTRPAASSKIKPPEPPSRWLSTPMAALAAACAERPAPR